jgi:flavin-dependent thymidylate synthase
MQENISSHNNKVVLLGYYGGDKTHALSAWQSTGFDIDDDYEQLINSASFDSEYVDRLFELTKGQKQKSVQELLTFLAENNHHTPFEKSTLHFQVRADIATHIQFLKHRIGVSINTESARYKELEDKYYLPSDWAEFDGLKLDLTQVASFFWDEEDEDDEELDEDIEANIEEVLEQDILTTLDWYAQLGHDLYHEACAKLTPVVGRKRAKETARYFLPYCKQLDFDVCFNFRSFMHFQRLRNSKHGQKEIKLLAQTMLELVENIPDKPFELSLQAFSQKK